MSEVYFSNLRAQGVKDNVINKIGRLYKKAGLDHTFSKGDLVAVKTHFGEEGNTTFLRPQFVAKMVDLVGADGGKPFVTDSNTLYTGMRANAVDHTYVAAKHGFCYPVINAPVIIADGLRGNDQVDIPVNLKRCRSVKVGSAAVQADSIMVVSHFKGHMMTGFGGAMKNLGMGFGSRAGKLEMHHDVHPQVNQENCVGCGLCAKNCPQQAIKVTKKKASIDKKKCVGCGECYIVCRNKAIDPGEWTDTTAIQEKIVEYCYGLMQGKAGRIGYMTFVMDFTPLCDCAGWSDSPVVPDIGVVASTDIVAIDQACADLVNGETSIAKTRIKEPMGPGTDKIRAMHDFDWTVQLEYAEKLGLGSREYKLIKV
jgi:uncharacterized protein